MPHPAAVTAFEHVSLSAFAGRDADFADGVSVAAGGTGHDRGLVGGEVGDGGESVVADAVGAAPVPGGGGVGVVTGDGGLAALAAAEDVDAPEARQSSAV